MKAHYSLPLLWLFAMPVFGAQQVNQTLAAPTNLKLEVIVQRGEVNIVPWDQPQIQLQGTLDELSEGLVFENRDGRVVIEDKMPKSYQGNDSEGTQLTIKVPASLNLNADGVSCDFTLENLKGELSIGSVSGDIAATNLEGSVKVSSVSGDIETRKLTGTVSIESVSGTIKDSDSSNTDGYYKSVSGDIALNNQSDSVRIEQVSGETEATLANARTVKYNAVSGNAELTLKGDVKLSAESVSGDISIRLLTPADTQLSINGGPGGSIKNELSNTKAESPQYGPGSTLNTRLGNGSGAIDIATLSGEITLKK